MQTVRCLVRALSAPGALVALLLAVSCLVLALPAAQASASDIQHQSSGGNAADTRGIAISIIGMTPQVATPSSTVTVSGALANHTGSAMSGITVQAQTSRTLFNGRAEMTSFARSGGYPYLIQPAGKPAVTGTVPSGATVRWSVSFPASTFYDRFGVFPLQVQASAPRGGYTATARTFLPYWMGGSASSQPLQVAWIWPLVDTPQQGACSNTLATSRLAGSVASGGRLSTLLGAGATWAKDDQLTWNIDPALLSDVSVMTHQYRTGGSSACTGRSIEKASPAASEWLSTLRTTTAGQPAFLTPYANVDVAALSHAGLDASIRTAYQLGDTVAGQILPRTFGPTGGGTGDDAVLKPAWPADGRADAEVLTSLANDGGINTLVLSSGEMPSSTPGYDNALGRTTSGIGTSVSVLLADSGITSQLGTASPSPTEAGQFTFVQDFLAQTAMIASEAPNSQRSLVIAPPPGWNPSPAEATALLSLTHKAPWLRSAGLTCFGTMCEADGSFAAAADRADSGAGCSHGAPCVIESSAVASAGDGSQLAGGAITRERDAPGDSAAIIAVCARKSCVRANWLACVRAVDAVPSRLVILELAESTDMLLPTPLTVLASASSAPADVDRSSLLLSTTVLMPPSLARLVSTPASARPSAGHAALSTAPSPVPVPVVPNVCGNIWPATV